MGNLFVSVLNSANAIRVYDRQMSVIQNNVANANTPGYVRQVQTLEAMRFDVDSGLPGGISPGPVLSSRVEYAEQNVRNQSSAQGYSDQKASELARIEPLFDPSAAYGVAGSISKFFNAFSQLSVNPNDQIARQSVLDGARSLTDAFNQTAAGLTSASQDADQQIRQTVDAVNRIGEQIQEINKVYRANQSSMSDAGLDTKMHSALEDLSQLTDFTLIKSDDGTMAVYIGGQTPLVVGDHFLPLRTDSSQSWSSVLDSTGSDITGQLHQGKLTALLDQKNKALPAYMADLNKLAQNLADGVNAQLAAGVDANGAAPTTDLFQYDAAHGVAMSLGLTSITPDGIAAATPEAPGGNGNALTIASMGKDKAIDGFTYAEYFGGLGGRVGRALASAREDAQTRAALTTQARSFRQEISGVSLDEEAAHLMQVQRSYQAMGKLMQVLNEVTDTLIQSLR